jgi:filamentous hemagglutinin
LGKSDGSVGGNDPVYACAAEHLGSWGTLALGIAEGVFWAGFPGMTGLRSLGGELGDPVQSGPATGQRASIGWTGMIGEEDLARLGGEAHEAKVGYQYLSPEIKVQITKDLWLRSNRGVDAVWHFYRSPVTGIRGPSEPLRHALEQAGFEVVLEGGTP